METSELKEESPCGSSANVKRRSIKEKNLEEEVEMILSQDDSDDHIDFEMPQTPTTSDKEGQQQQSRFKNATTTPRASEMAALKDFVQTPRRSCRKSVKPTQDYDDIIKRSMRSVGRSAKKSLMHYDVEENEENMESLLVEEDSQPKWTASVVGKSSTKRGRKSKRNTGTTTKGKKMKKEDDHGNQDDGVVADDSVSKRKLDLDCVLSKGINEENSLEKVKVDQTLLETVQQETCANEDKIENDHDSLENTKECGDHDTVHKEQQQQSLQAMEVDIMPQFVISSPREYRQITEDEQSQQTPPQIVISSPRECNKTTEDEENKESTPEIVINSPKECNKTTEAGENIETTQKLTEQYKAEEHCEEKIDSQEEQIAKAEVIGNVTEVEDPEQENIIHLIQEDSEDFQDLPINVIKEDNDILDTKNNIIENNVAITIDDRDDKELSNDSFGSYLKSNKINVTDLGLIPLNDDDDIGVNGDSKSPTDSEEMPSLIILDDEEDDGEAKETGNAGEARECNVKPNLNETFETTEEVKPEIHHLKPNISFEAYEAVDNSLQTFLRYEAAAEDTVEMGALQLSEDEATPQKAPRIVLTTTDDKNATILSTPKGSTNPKNTPKHKAKPFRFPTPHSIKMVVNRTPTSSVKKLPVHHNNMGFAMTTLEPKEIILRGIRKRSLSMCLLGGGDVNNPTRGSANKRQRPLKGPLATHRQQKAVNFYSPANQTTIIDDLDKIIEDSVRKDKSGKRIHQTTNVTTRRKRSLSLDESMMSKSLLSKIPRPGAVGNSSGSSYTSAYTSASSTKLTRTKLPNFAAIHQKNFQKMENVIEHVTRKQERAKILINSATKIKTASAQKNISVDKNQKAISSRLEKPKAFKKIDLEGTTTNQIKVKPLLPTKTLTKAAGDSGIQKPSTKENHSMPAAEESKLPHPRDLPHPIVFKLVNKHQQHNTLLNKKHLKPTQTINVLANTKASSSISLKKQQQQQQQPKQQQKQTQQQKPFNLSTQLTARPQIVTNTTLASTSSTKTTSATSSASKSSSSAANVFSLSSTQDKMASRLQRHMDLFKGRAISERTGVASRNNNANIKGVRSNRRFELQMQHRKNLEN